MELPFPPFVGLILDAPRIIFGEFYTIARVTWLTNGHDADLVPRFFCELEDSYPNGSYTYEYLKRIADLKGWNVQEYGPGEYVDDTSVQRIYALQKELSQVPYMGVDPKWDEQASPEETKVHLRFLESLKSEKDRDSSLWRKIVNCD